MLSIDSPPVPEPQEPATPLAPEVMLANGRRLLLEGMSTEELHRLQWEQEQRFAKAILALPKGSSERALVIGQAYDTVCTILAAQQAGEGPLVMGVDRRYTRLVLELLNRQIYRGIGQPRLFEIGYGSGTMLKEVSNHGFRVSGIEVSSAMRDEALGVLGETFSDRLLLGDLCNISREMLPDKPSLVYWNYVFEHICPDEIGDYLQRIHQLLIPGGTLVTITPHWLMRPSDVTGDFCLPRTEARGLHLKEYRLAEVSRLLKQSGFRRVATPLVVSQQRIYLAGGGLRLLKQLCEGLFDRLPVRHAHALCLGAGMSITLATKSSQPIRRSPRKPYPWECS